MNLKSVEQIEREKAVRKEQNRRFYQKKRAEAEAEAETEAETEEKASEAKAAEANFLQLNVDKPNFANNTEALNIEEEQNPRFNPRKGRPVLVKNINVDGIYKKDRSRFESLERLLQKRLRQKDRRESAKHVICNDETEGTFYMEENDCDLVAGLKSQVSELREELARSSTLNSRGSDYVNMPKEEIVQRFNAVSQLSLKVEYILFILYFMCQFMARLILVVMDSRVK